MREVLHQDGYKRVEMIRDEHVPGIYHFQTVFWDDPILAKNERIRKEGLMPYKHRLPALGEGESVECVYAFRIPPDQFSAFKLRHPDIWDNLMSDDEHVRLRAAKQFQLLHPEWCITEAHR